MSTPRTLSDLRPLAVYAMGIDPRSWVEDPLLTVTPIDLDGAVLAGAADTAPGIFLVSGARLSELVRTGRLEGLASLGALVAVADGEHEIQAARRAGAVAVLPSGFVETDGALARALLRELVGADGSARSELERLARDAVHELRTPLTVIVEFAGLLEDGVGGELEGRARDYVGQVLAAAQRLADQLDDYRGSVRARLGTLRLRPAWFEIDTLVEKIRERHDVEVDPGLPEWIWLDGAAVGTALERLLERSVRLSSRTRPPTLRITGDPSGIDFLVAYEGREPELEDCLLMREGPRECDAHLRSLASVFGLGVTYADDVARASGGSLSLEPIDGEGGRFVLRIPAETALDPSHTVGGVQALSS